MNGLEKITARIENDARAEIDEVLSAAKEQAEKIRLAAEEKNAARLQSGRAQNAAAAESHRARLVSAAGMESRQELLGVKQSCIDEAFARAKEQLLSGSDETLTELLAGFAARESGSGHEELLFSDTLRARIGEAVVRRANELKDGAAFTLSAQTRETDGVVLRSGNVEINGSVSTRLAELRESMAFDVAETLFRG